DDRLDPGVDQVLGDEHQVEEVVVVPGRGAAQGHDDHAGGQVAGEQADHVDRQHAHDGGDDPGADQERHRAHRHHVECVDLVGDAHRADLRGESGADLG